MDTNTPITTPIPEPKIEKMDGAEAEKTKKKEKPKCKQYTWAKEQAVKDRKAKVLEDERKRKKLFKDYDELTERLEKKAREAQIVQEKKAAEAAKAAEEENKKKLQEDDNEEFCEVIFTSPEQLKQLKKREIHDYEKKTVQDGQEPEQKTPEVQEEKESGSPKKIRLE